MKVVHKTAQNIVPHPGQYHLKVLMSSHIEKSLFLSVILWWLG
jgi:hypothetical protein